MSDTATAPASTPDWAQGPEHIFLTKQEVIARYRWSRSKGYEVMQSSDFPRDIEGRYRLDTLLAWEQARLTPKPREVKTLPPPRGARPGMKVRRA